jgi:hypothetical protein
MWKTETLLNTLERIEGFFSTAYSMPDHKLLKNATREAITRLSATLPQPKEEPQVGPDVKDRMIEQLEAEIARLKSIK